MSVTRVETGIVQFDDDWPGFFLRGDDAFALAQLLKQARTTFPRTAAAQRLNDELKGWAERLDEVAADEPAVRFSLRC